MRIDEDGRERCATLGEYLELVRSSFGPSNPAIKFLEDKIAASPNGADELVLATDQQMRGLLLKVMFKDKKAEDETIKSQKKS